MADDPSAQFDGAMAQRASAAEAANQVIRYVGSVDVTNGTAAIKVSRYVRTKMWGRCNVKITGHRDVESDAVNSTAAVKF